MIVDNICILHKYFLDNQNILLLTTTSVHHDNKLQSCETCNCAAYKLLVKLLALKS